MQVISMPNAGKDINVDEIEQIFNDEGLPAAHNLES